MAKGTMTAENNVLRQHWESVYQAKTPTAVSWYQPHLEQSLAFIRASSPGKDARVIDIGGGASTLVDDLLEDGVRHVTVVDISGQALAKAKRRLGAKAGRVTWVEGDVTAAPLPSQAYDIWHDRAVFHFLVVPEGRAKYIERMHRALRPGAHAIMATFALNGPPKCSGLSVVRYGAESLSQELGPMFSLIESVNESHRTPAGVTQEFIYCRFKYSA